MENDFLPDLERHGNISFPVVVSRGPHPFPSRTRKLSLLEPMVLRGQLRGRVGSRRDYLEKPAREISRAFIFPVMATPWLSLLITLSITESDNDRISCYLDVAKAG